MIFNAEERRLFILFYSGSVLSTVAVLRDALTDITDPDDRAAAGSLLRKLEGLSGAELEIFEEEARYCDE